MKRPILVAIIGYIIGIIMGLYCKSSIVFLYILIFLIIAITKKIKKQFKHNKKFKFFSISRYLRYLKLIFNKKIIIIIFLFSVISNFIIILKNQKFETLYNNIQDVKAIGIIVSSKEEKDYKDVYKMKVISVNNLSKFRDTYLYIKVNKKINLDYGDKINIQGEFEKPSTQRNYGGFDYKEYLKTQNINGTINSSNIKVLEKNKANKIMARIFKIKEKIRNRAHTILKDKSYSIFLALILGDTSCIDEQTQENFRDSNMSHILAISGMHISYIVIGITIVLNKSLGKKLSKIITIFILLIYILLTGFSPSIVRASIMGIMILLGGIIHRKNDVFTSMSISLFIILIYNPYLITNMGLQFSYIGTLGIILFRNNVLKILNKGKKNKSKIKEILSVTISAQILIFPLMIFHLNTFGIYFLITNVLISLIIGPVIILGFILLSIFNFIIYVVSKIFNLGIELILIISNIAKLPFSKIYIRTPKIYEILIYYIISFFINCLYSILSNKNPNPSELRVKYTLELLK